MPSPQQQPQQAESQSAGEIHLLLPPKIQSTDPSPTFCNFFGEKQLNKAPCLKDLPARWHVWDMDFEAVGHDEHAHRDGGKSARGPELVSPSTWNLRRSNICFFQCGRGGAPA